MILSGSGTCQFHSLLSSENLTTWSELLQELSINAVQKYVQVERRQLALTVLFTKSTAYTKPATPDMNTINEPYQALHENGGHVYSLNISRCGLFLFALWVDKLTWTTSLLFLCN